MEIKWRLEKALKSKVWLSEHTEDDEALCRDALARIEATDDLANAVVQYLTAVGAASEPLKAAMLRLTRKP